MILVSFDSFVEAQLDGKHINTATAGHDFGAKYQYDVPCGYMYSTS